MTYHEHEEKLFTKWAQRARKLHDADMIAKDGLLFRGELWWDGLSQLHRPADEEQLWDIPFGKADNATRLQGFYENAPIVRINCKKQPDTKAASNAVLQKYMDNYADLLKEQISMYNTDIILCIGGQGIMVNFLQKHLYEDLEQVNRHCYYSPKANVLVVKQYHPNYNVYSRKEMYSSMIQDYQNVLKAKPQFPTQR